MAAPVRVTVDHNRSKHYASPPCRDGSWTADRPGETIGAAHPCGPALGNQGPDQGYVLKLAKRFRDDLVLRPGEHAADTLEGACAVALRRASLYGRAPIGPDVCLALTVWGYLSDAADELVEYRRGLFSELHHTTIHYFGARKLADLVPEETLRMSPGRVAEAHVKDWKGPLGL
ncbi:MAG: hypothetical protein HOH36_10990 [Acidimicrobiaceae bacterium]|jgi:hypothetical protein|nr:hypothetical protein [Acidimicrobiaceae bacterium]MBT5582070.1 hypothetical protein [Acidimicrobiaceae bacterium]MBT5850953.1 hypothetical protein [Acidimicrobiaceae bacterium]